MNTTWICRYCETQNPANAVECEVCGRSEHVQELNTMGELPRYGSFSGKTLHQPLQRPSFFGALDRVGEEKEKAREIYETAEAGAGRGSYSKGIAVTVIIAGILIVLGVIKFGQPLIPLFVIGGLGAIVYFLFRQTRKTSSGAMPSTPPPEMLPQALTAIQLSEVQEGIWFNWGGYRLDLLKVETGKVMQTFHLESEEHKKFWLAEGHLIETLPEKDLLRFTLYSLTDGLRRQLRMLYLRTPRHPVHVALNRQATLAAVIRHTGELVLLRLSAHEKRHLFLRDENQSSITALCFSGTSSFIIIGRDDGTLECRDSHTLDQRQHKICETGVPILQMVCSADDQWVGVWQVDGFISIHDIASDELLPPFTIHFEKEVRGIVFHPFLNRLMILSPGEIWFLDPHSRKVIGILGTGDMSATAILGRENGTVLLADLTGNWRSLTLPGQLLLS